MYRERERETQVQFDYVKYHSWRGRWARINPNSDAYLSYLVIRKTSPPAVPNKEQE